MSKKHAKKDSCKLITLSIGESPLTLPQHDEIGTQIVLVQPEIDGTEKSVRDHPEIKWDALPDHTLRFKHWGRHVIDEVSFSEKRFQKYEALSLQDAETKHKVVKKLMKWANTIKAGWNEQNQAFVQWAEFVPAAHKSTLNELILISSERILELKKAIEKLRIHESQLEAFVEGRW